MTRSLQELARLAWPIIWGRLLEGVVGLASAAFVSDAGVETMAGVGLGAALGSLYGTFASGIATGATVIASYTAGGHDTRRANAVLGATLGAAVVIGALTCLFGLWLSPVACGFSSDALVSNTCTEYSRVRLIEVPFWAIASGLRGFQYGRGDTRSSMWVGVVTTLAQVALDYYLVVVSGLAAVGAAIGAVLTTVLYLALIVWTQFRRPERPAIPPRREVSSLVRMTLIMSAQLVVDEGAFTIIGMLVGSMAAHDGAAHLATTWILWALFVPAAAVGESIEVRLGQTLGRELRKHSRLPASLPASLELPDGLSSVVVTNASLGGASLEVTSPVQVGAQGRLRLRIDGQPVTRAVRVVRAAQAEPQSLGVEFLEYELTRDAWTDWLEAHLELAAASAVDTLDAVKQWAASGAILATGVYAVCLAVCLASLQALIPLLTEHPTVADKIFTATLWGGLGQIALALRQVARHCLTAVGDVKVPAVIVVVCAWLFGPTLTYVLGVEAGWGVVGAWVARIPEAVGASVLLWARLWTGRWRLSQSPRVNQPSRPT